MPRPPVTWIHLWHSCGTWSVAFQRHPRHHRYKSHISYASRCRLADLVDTLSRRRIPPYPHYAVHPLPGGWCAYPTPIKVSNAPAGGKELRQCPTSAALPVTLSCS